MRSEQADLHVIGHVIRELPLLRSIRSLVMMAALVAASLIEIATVMARGLAGQPVKCGGECARIAEADIERNTRDGQFPLRQ